jgi:diguanylate cyclase
MTVAIAASANPTEVARETIRQLASRRIAPTPDNYARIYGEISGETTAHPAVASLERVAAEMTRLATASNGAPPALGGAVKRQKWDEVTQALLRLVGAAASAESLAWHALVRDLLRQWELRHDGLPASRKREALEQVLETSRGDPIKLYQRLVALVRNWTERPLARTASGVVQPIERGAGDAAVGGLLRDLLSQTLEYAVTDRLGYSPELASESGRLSILAREASESRDFNRLAQALRQFWLKLELRGESVDEIMRSLVTLVRLLTRNIGELADDPWMREQLAHAEELLKEPLDPRALREAEKGFREVAFRQAMLKGSLDEAKNALKSMVGQLIDRLDDLTVSTGGYHARFGEYAGRIAAATDLSDISAVIANLLADTRGAEDAMRRSRDELEEARRVAHAHEERVRTLERELSEVGARVKEDQLTSVLNRRGLEEAYAVEEARAARTGSPLSIALLDVDNFKHLNDRLGHLAGDGALKHLAGILRDAVRPSDVIARYGGEEFVLLLPDTGIEEGVQVMIRVQRALTRRFFLHQNERVLITFSAGVALWQPGEARDDAIARADRAMYEAKQTGKNRVCVAPDPV